MYEIKRNEEFNSNEIYFDSVPAKEIRESLKSIGCRWHKVKKCWYSRKTEEEIRAAIEGKKEIKKDEVINDFGVKVGDVFHMSWGYDQTNNDFFQVIAVTKKKAYVVEVCPDYESSATGPMAENRTLTYKEGQMLPRVKNSFWIKDNEKGELKTIRDWSGTNKYPCLLVGSHCASRCSSGSTYYESWYA